MSVLQPTLSLSAAVHLLPAFSVFHLSLILLFFSPHYLPSHLSYRLIPLSFCAHHLCDSFILFLYQTASSLFFFTLLFLILFLLYAHLIFSRFLFLSFLSKAFYAGFPNTLHLPSLFLFIYSLSVSLPIFLLGPPLPNFLSLFLFSSSIPPDLLYPLPMLSINSIKTRQASLHKPMLA